MPDRTVADLRANPRNPRRITDKKLGMLYKALAKFGDLGGIVFNRTSGQLVGGHQRVKALPEGGVINLTREHKRPTKNGTVAEGYLEVDGSSYAYREVEWNEATEKAANLAANKGAGDFDLPAVQEFVNELQDLDFDLDLTMFDEDERVALTPPEAEQVEEDEDQGEFEPDKARETDIKPGDVLQLGPHRLMCGDSFSRADVERLLDGEKVDLVFTDPPYNLAGQAKMVAKGLRGAAKRLSESEWDKQFSFAKVEANLLWALAENAAVYVCTSHFLFGEIIAWMDTWASHTCYCVWKKNNPMPSLQKRHWTFGSELVAYATRGKHHFAFPAEGHAHSVWEFAKVSKCDLHPTMKPVSIPGHAIAHSSRQGHLVLDLFGGAGSTLLACEQLGRRARVMELDPLYCQVIVDRWEAKSGSQAVVLGRGIAEVGEATDG